MQIEKLGNEKIELEAELEKALQMNNKAASDNHGHWYLELEKLKKAQN